MRITKVFILLTSLLSFQTLAAPAPATDIATVHEPTSDLAERALPVVGIILGIASKVVTDIADGVFKLLSGEAAEKQIAFTTHTLARLRQKYPTYNVLIFHDRESKLKLHNWQHAHVELPWGILDFTKGYEVYVFESGGWCPLFPSVP